MSHNDTQKNNNHTKSYHKDTLNILNCLKFLYFELVKLQKKDVSEHLNQAIAALEEDSERKFH